MKAYAALAFFVALSLAGAAVFVLQTDWSQPDRTADPSTSLTVGTEKIACSTLLGHTCDRDDQRIVERAQPRIEAFLAYPNLKTLVATGRVTASDAASIGVQICSNGSWFESSSVFTTSRPDMPHYASLAVWSASTQLLCPTALS